MKILIIGAKGFVGHMHIIFFLKDHRVWGAEVLTSGDTNFFY